MANIIFPKRWTSKPPLGAQVNWGHPLSVGLQCCLLFNEGGGLALKDLANPVRTATINSTSPSTFTACKNGMGLSKPSASGSGYITLAPTLTNLTSPFTIETLINLTAVAGYQTILVSSTGADGLWIHAGKIDLFNGTDHDGTATLAAGKWYHVVATYAGGTAMTYYLNGVRDAAPSDTPVTTVPSNIFSYSGDSTESLNGKMEYFRYWSRPLTASEVNNLYVDPYAMLAAQSPRVKYFVAPAAGGTPFLPLLGPRQDTLLRM